MYYAPDKKNSFEFIYEGEIRFGPPFYKIKLNGQFLENKLFGFEFKWDSNSKYLALQEWETIDYKKGPITNLFLINLENLQFSRLFQTTKGFVYPSKFENDYLIAERQYLQSGKIEREKLELTNIKNWFKLSYFDR